MTNLQDYLEQLELSETEAKLYLKLLKTGPIKVRDLATAIGIKRTTVYIYIDQLVERGLIVKLVKGAQKLIAASDPESTLKSLVEQKMQKAKTLQEDFPKMLETINTSMPVFKDVDDAQIKYFKGINAIKKVYEEAFSGNEFRSYVKVEETSKLSSDNPNLFSNAFKNNKKLKVWEIMYDSPTSRRQAFRLLSETNNYFYKFMPSELKWSLTSEDILMYDGKVALINYKEKISCVVLQSADYYNNSKEIFDFIWKIIPEPNP